MIESKNLLKYKPIIEFKLSKASNLSFFFFISHSSFFKVDLKIVLTCVHSSDINYNFKESTLNLKY